MKERPHTTLSPAADAFGRKLYRDIRLKIRPEMRRARLTPLEEHEKRRRVEMPHRKKEDVIADVLQTKVPQGLTTRLLYARLCVIPGFTDVYSFHSFENLLAPGSEDPLPLWLVVAIAQAMDIPPAALFPPPLEIEADQWQELLDVLVAADSLSNELRCITIDAQAELGRTIKAIAENDEARAFAFAEKLPPGQPARKPHRPSLRRFHRTGRSDR
jgi:hypothetical protein